MGIVSEYRARDARLKRDVAIKILPDEFSRDAARVGRFQREAEVLASLNHPNIAAIYACRVGSCELKLSEASLNRVRTEIDWSKYASHYFWTAIELRVLVPDPSRGEGFWLASVNRSRSDGLGGFVGRLIRGKVRGEAQNGMEAALSITKTMMERR